MLRSLRTVLRDRDLDSQLVSRLLSTLSASTSAPSGARSAKQGTAGGQQPCCRLQTSAASSDDGSQAAAAAAAAPGADAAPQEQVLSPFDPNRDFEHTRKIWYPTSLEQDGTWREGALEDADLVHRREALLGAELSDDSDYEETVSLAGEGQPCWSAEVVDEDTATWSFELDLTAGLAHNLDQNALLCDEAKTTMFVLHMEDPKKYNTLFLSQMFRIRQQRVMAILALKEIELEYAKDKEAWKALVDAAKAEAAAHKAGQADAAAAAGQDTAAAAQAATATGEPAESGETDATSTAEAAAPRAEANGAEPEVPEQPETPYQRAKRTRAAINLEAPEEVLQEQVQAYYQAEQAALKDDSFWKDPDNLAAVMENEIFGALEPRGSGERHVKLLPRIPRFRFMKRSEVGPIEASAEELRSHLHRLEERRGSLQEARIQLSDRLNRLAQHVLPPQRQRRQPAQRQGQGQVSTASMQHVGLTPAQQQQVVDMRAHLEARQKGQGQGAQRAEAPAELAELDKIMRQYEELQLVEEELARTDAGAPLATGLVEQTEDQLQRPLKGYQAMDPHLTSDMFLPPPVTRYRQQCEMAAQKEEAHMVLDFAERLNYNLGKRHDALIMRAALLVYGILGLVAVQLCESVVDQIMVCATAELLRCLGQRSLDSECLIRYTAKTGQGIRRDSRITKPPARPKEGWSLVVKDRSGGELKQTFVATPEGRKQKLTPSEELYLERQKPKARAAYMPGP